MSAPPNPNRHGRGTPLSERAQSHNNTLAIRIVPYTPPRLDSDGRTPSQASSRPSAGEPWSGGGYTYDGHGPGGGFAGEARRGGWRGDPVEGYASGPGSALSSPSASALSLAGAKDPRVSGSKLATSPSDSLTAAVAVAPALRSPSEGSTHGTRGTGVNASSSSLHGSRHGGSSSPVPLSPGAAPAHVPRPLSRRANLVAVHSDKTFSLVRLRPQSDVSGSLGSLGSPPLSYSSRTSSSHDHPSISAWSDDRASSPLTGISATGPDYRLSELPPLTPSPGSSTTHLVEDPIAEDPIAESPWNYRMIGGLRKVPKTPDLKHRKPLHTTAPSAPETPLAPLPEVTVYRDDEPTPSRTVVPKASFASAESGQTVSTSSETTNYKVFGPSSSPQHSSDSLPLPSSSHSNYELLGESSPAAPAAFSSSPPARPYSDDNYVVHGDPSPSPSSLVAVPRKPRPTYSQESLLVPPLRPAKKKSYERIGYYKQRSRENLRARAGSLQSLKSISSIITTQDPSQAFFTAPVLINFGASVSRPGRSRDADAPPAQQYPWSTPQTPGSSTSLNTAPSTIAQRPPVQMIQAHPHQWSSQLSTVVSESEGEGDSEVGPTRSVSPETSSGNGHRRRSSNGWASSLHSRQMQSISSSLAAQLEEAASGSDSIDRPQPTYARAGPSQPLTVRDQDEHGDGLADLQQQPSRSGLSAFFSSSNSSSRNLHSSSSSRANSLTGSIPAWAKVYYGSGERRFLSAPSISSPSEAGDSRPGSSAFQNSDSPNTDHFPLPIRNSRRRAREVRQNQEQRPFSDSGSMEIGPAPSGQDYNVFRSLKRKTSSIWSPHLRMDRRATRYSVWDPPSVTWSADTGILGKRNAQVLLFTLGFIFPFAWIIAALLPLPPNPKFEMLEEGDSSNSRFRRVQGEFAYQAQIIDGARYESARWWRNLNRMMSILGLLIIGAIIALVVVGAKQGWIIRTSK
ncbi:hypothetical protein B0T26DRAFT_749774 [Lasiosphaeria miniovina]|uniref:Serine-rich protein n=1 Tax=Lasiosphaeria miniovina TaxID=1954250 RepID=A0AA40E343_9PEZI|nr:uncharacterized protein B0T26DRAFT_749774 [Lasiosphaeria miniovina]KAK0722361.1 hypothetical protein B0T26DRAFT_749774 [Lasiosphaeria miniovina]